MRKANLAPAVLLLGACVLRSPAPDHSSQLDEARLARLLAARPESFGTFLERAPEWRLQILLAEVVTDSSGGRPRLVRSGFRLDAEYFYPASSIKLCAAVAALQWLDEANRDGGPAIDVDTPLVFRPLFDDEEVEAVDLSHVSAGTITIAHEITKLFVVSDNRAFNRLYELTGQTFVNRAMWAAGLDSARIRHRLSEFRSERDNRRFPAIDFLAATGTRRVPEREEPPLEKLAQLDGDAALERGMWIGDARIEDGARVEGPFDFRGKNAMSLRDLQDCLARVVRPDVDSGGPPFELGEHRRLLIEAMELVPRDCPSPRYDPREYPDDYVKYFLPGLERVLPRERLRVLGKVGQAYGFTVENSYVEDTATGRAFFLAAVIYTNADGVLNDDAYEYESVALPFLADLAEAVARELWER